MTKSELIELIYSAIPASHLIHNLDIEAQGGTVCFTWWGVKYEVQLSLAVSEKKDGVWTGGTDRARLMRALLCKQQALNACALITSEESEEGK